MPARLTREERRLRVLKTAHIDMTIDPKLLGRIDDWLDSQLIPPTRSEAIRRMIEIFLDREEGI